jgi:hypothetical protein
MLSTMPGLDKPGGTEYRRAHEERYGWSGSWNAEGVGPWPVADDAGCMCAPLPV